MEKVLMEFTKEQNKTIKRISEIKDIPKVKIFRLFCDLLQSFDGESDITVVVLDKGNIRISEDLKTIQDYSGSHIVNFSYHCKVDRNTVGEKQVTVTKGITVEGQ